MILAPDMRHSRALIRRILDESFQKNFEPKMVRWVGAQKQVNWAKKSKTCTHCDITHRQPQIRKKIFEPKPKDLPNP